jgi:hypothetical protein
MVQDQQYETWAVKESCQHCPIAPGDAAPTVNASACPDARVFAGAASRVSTRNRGWILQVLHLSGGSLDSRSCRYVVDRVGVSSLGDRLSSRICQTWKADLLSLLVQDRTLLALRVVPAQPGILIGETHTKMSVAGRLNATVGIATMRNQL